MGSGIMPLVGMSLSFQNFVVVEKKMRFQAFFNQMTRVDDVESCRSYGKQVRF